MIGAAACLLLASLTPSQHHDPERHFSIEWPGDWRAIPDGAHARAGLDSSSTTQGIEAFLGFSATGEYAHPYAEIQVLKASLVGYSEPDLHAWLHETAGDFDIYSEGMALPSVSEIKRPLLDTERWMYIQPITIDGASGTPIRAFHVGLLGTDHLLQLYLYATEAQFEAMAKPFDASIRSFRFDAGYSWSPDPGYRIASIILLLLALLFVPLVFRKKRAAKDSEA